MRGYIEISKNQLIENYKNIKEKANKDIICVIKSNAYGHGLLEVAKILAPLSPKMFAVSTIEECMLIRKSLIFTPVLLLGSCDNLTYASNFRITLSVINLEYLKILKKSNLPIFIHLLIDTGMNRDGIKPSEIEEALKIIAKSKLILKGVFTHFASINTYEKQNEIFSKCLIKIPNNGLLIHSQASSTFLIKNDNTTAIRIGLTMYGLDNNVSFTKPILTLKAKAINEIKISEFEMVSYNQEPVIKDGYVYTIPLGYGDGLLRNHQNIVEVSGLILLQIGITCMDHFMVYSDTKIDLSSIFVVIGSHQTINDIANKNATIPYEVAAHLSRRIKRIIV